jgi:flagellar motor protein MotB
MVHSRDPFEFSDRPATPEWFVTFADMMSLLLALFVMLASFSEVREEERFRAISDSLRGQFGRTTSAGNSAEGSIAARDSRLAAEINHARGRRADLLGVNLSEAITGAADTTGTSVTLGNGDRASTARR